MLSLIGWGAEVGRRNLYLGYMIRETQKMAYKMNYRPFEVFRDGRWRTEDVGFVSAASPPIVGPKTEEA